MSTAALQSAINILAEKETENNWTKKKDALDTIYVSIFLSSRENCCSNVEHGNVRCCI